MTWTADGLVVTRHGGPEVLAVRGCEFPPPGEHEVLVKVAASGVNFIDVYRREGRYPTDPPFVSGKEGAGVVVAVGAAAKLAIGDRVAWVDTPGSTAGYVAVPAAEAVLVPAEVSLEIAAAVILQGMTAHYLVNSTYSVQPGDHVLIHAAAGGVGQLLVQLAKAKGATVIATASTPAKLATASALGADHVINYEQVPDLAVAVRVLTDGVGVAVAYDGVGRTTFDASLASLRRRGMLALFGAASGPVPPVEPQRLNSGGSLFLTRPTLADYVADEAELRWRSGEVFESVASGALEVEVGGSYPLADGAQAFVDLEGRRTTGKLLIIP